MMVSAMGCVKQGQGHAVVFGEQELRERLRADGVEAIGAEPAELANHMSAELRTWEPIVRSLGLYQVN